MQKIFLALMSCVYMIASAQAIANDDLGHFAEVPTWCKPVFQLAMNYSVRLPILANYCGWKLSGAMNEEGIYTKSSENCTPTEAEVKLQQVHDKNQALLCYNIEALRRSGTYFPPVHGCQ